MSHGRRRRIKVTAACVVVASLLLGGLAIAANLLLVSGSGKPLSAT